MAQTMTLNGKTVNDRKKGNQGNDEVELLRNKLAEMTKETSQFTYIITHDLQAPLRMITGFLELLEKKYADKLDAGAKQYIEYAVKGSVKMKNLIFDLLEYSRLNSAVHEFEKVNLNEVLKETKEKLAPVFEQTSATITADALPVVRASKKLMEQLLKHLLDNAIKFRREEAPQISIGAAKESDCWKISISDNGTGIDPAFFEKIFIIFRRLQTDEVRYPGTGAGLTVCKKIAELHGGVIGVESTPGTGSTFWFTIPVK
ncbi:MAG: sensor histidine kinase [Bacteroidota bacterium]